MPCRPAISSMSLGRAWEHALFTKLAEAAKVGYQGIEIFYEDLEYLASTYESSPATTSTEKEHILQAATEVRDWCLDLKLQVICLQPFMFYEGLTDSSEHAARIDKLRFWFELVKVMGTDLILVPSNFMPEGKITGDMDAIVKDMTEIADLGLQQNPVVRFAYENLAWGSHVDRWEQVWDVVQEVNRPNFGMCIDTFNICGRIWADPVSTSGKTPRADEDLEESLRKLESIVDVSKIFFTQIIDGERMKEPLAGGHSWFQEDQPARMSWSRNARLFAYEGGYLPISKVMDVLFKGLKFNGWVSMELFSRTMADPDGNVPQTHAERGIASWMQMAREYGLDGSKDDLLNC